MNQEQLFTVAECVEYGDSLHSEITFPLRSDYAYDCIKYFDAISCDVCVAAGKVTVLNFDLHSKAMLIADEINEALVHTTEFTWLDSYLQYHNLGRDALVERVKELLNEHDFETYFDVLRYIQDNWVLTAFEQLQQDAADNYARIEFLQRNYN